MRVLILLIISLSLLLSCNNKEKRYSNQEIYSDYSNRLPVTYQEKEQKAYEDAIQNMNMSDLISYLKEYPEGEYIEEVQSIKDSLWDEGIANYVEQAKSSKDKKAVRFFKKVLTYMKENDINEIGLNLTKKIDLKGYNDYPKEVRELMAQVYDSPPLSNENVISPTSLFGQRNLGEKNMDLWLIMGISKDMEHDLFKINYDESSISDSPLSMTIDEPADLPLSMTIEYTIKNQEEEGYFPEVWDYSEDDVFKSYLLGISIDFKFTFVIPNTNSKYTFTVHKDPSGNIGKVLNIRDGYGAMTEKTFVQFSNDLVSRFGFEATSETMHEKMMQSY